jgi:hypothetical protein
MRITRRCRNSAIGRGLSGGDAAGGPVCRDQRLPAGWVERPFARRWRAVAIRRRLGLTRFCAWPLVADRAALGAILSAFGMGWVR